MIVGLSPAQTVATGDDCRVSVLSVENEYLAIDNEYLAIDNEYLAIDRDGNYALSVAPWRVFTS